MISIIIPARNGAAITRNCLSSVLYSCGELQLSVQLILIDDASTPDEGILDLFRQVRREAQGYEIIIRRARSRLHYTGVFAAGLDLATHREIFFLSNDMVVTPHFIRALRGVATLDDRFGVVRGTSNWADSHPEYTIVPEPELKTYGDVVKFSAAQFDRYGFAYTEDRMLSGDAVLVKRAVIDAIGVLDCSMFGYFSDVDFGMRAHLAGFRLVCAQGAWLHHAGAGHLWNEATRSGRPMKELEAERMRLVQSAYETFRQKWSPDLPARFLDLDSNDYSALSERALRRPSLKCELPQTIAAELIGE